MKAGAARFLSPRVIRAAAALAAIPGLAAAETVPLRLAFLPTASAVPAGAVQFEDVHRFNGAIAPPGEPNLFRRALGMTDLGVTSLSAAYGFLPGLQGGIFWESRLQTAGLETRRVVWESRAAAPLSLAAAANAQIRTAAGNADDFSSGGAVSLQRSGKRWTALTAFAGQAGTLSDTGTTPGDYTLAWGLGFLRRGEHMNFFGEAVFPLKGRRTYDGRVPDGIPLLALGVGFALWRGTLDVLAVNTASVAAGNLLSGPDAPAPSREMKWRVGTAYRYGFDLSRNKATAAP